MSEPQDRPVATGGDGPTRRGRRTPAEVAAAPAPAAVWPGLSGGTYQPLSVPEIERIHATALDVLEEIGIGEPIPEILHYALPRGCTVDADGRLRFPRDLVEELMGVASPRLRSPRGRPRERHRDHGRARLLLHLGRGGHRPRLRDAVLPADAVSSTSTTLPGSSTGCPTSTATDSRSSPRSTARRSSSTTSTSRTPRSPGSTSRSRSAARRSPTSSR